MYDIYTSIFILFYNKICVPFLSHGVACPVSIIPCCTWALQSRSATDERNRVEATHCGLVRSVAKKTKQMGQTTTTWSYI